MMGTRNRLSVARCCCGSSYTQCTHCITSTGTFSMLVTLPTITGLGCSNCSGLSGASFVVDQVTACGWNNTFDVSFGDCGTKTVTVQLTLLAIPGKTWQLDVSWGSQVLSWGLNTGSGVPIDCDTGYSLPFLMRIGTDCASPTGNATIANA